MDWEERVARRKERAKDEAQERFQRRFSIDGMLKPLEEGARNLLGKDYKREPYSAKELREIREHPDKGPSMCLAAFVLDHARSARVAHAGGYAEGAAVHAMHAMKAAIAAGIVFKGIIDRADQARLLNEWRSKGGKASSKAAKGIRIWLEETLSKPSRRTAYVPDNLEGVGGVSSEGVVSRELWSNDDLYYQLLDEIEPDEPNAGDAYMVWRGENERREERVYERRDYDGTTKDISRGHFNRLAGEIRRELGLPRPARGRNKRR